MTTIWMLDESSYYTCDSVDVVMKKVNKAAMSPTPFLPVSEGLGATKYIHVSQIARVEP